MSYEAQSVFVVEVHQIKKSNKWECKLCGEKQSVKRHYGIGTAKECRIHVQKLNGIRGEINELKKSETAEIYELGGADDELDDADTKQEPQVYNARPNKSKWSDYLDKTDDVDEPTHEEAMYLGNTKVVLEVPKKRKKNNFYCPVMKENIATEYKYNDRNEPETQKYSQELFSLCDDGDLDSVLDI